MFSLVEWFFSVWKIIYPWIALHLNTELCIWRTSPRLEYIEETIFSKYFPSDPSPACRVCHFAADHWSHHARVNSSIKITDQWEASMNSIDQSEARVDSSAPLWGGGALFGQYSGAPTPGRGRITKNKYWTARLLDNVGQSIHICLAFQEELYYCSKDWFQSWTSIIFKIQI